MKKYAFIFAGQGSQKIGMGKDFYENFTKSKELLELASDTLSIDFKKIMFEENENINISKFTQPAILLNSMMIYSLLEKNTPKYALGHSLGEISAVCAMGGLDLKDAIFLTNKRGEFMQNCVDEKNPAGMLVCLGLSDEIVENLCKEARECGQNIWAANYNCDGQIVIAGTKAHLEAFSVKLKDLGAKRAMLLNMSVASHCPLMQKASDELLPLLDSYLKDMKAPVVSNATTDFYTDKNIAKIALKDQLVKPVLYKQSILKIDDEIDAYVEFGSNILAGLNKKITKKPTISIVDVTSFDTFLNDLSK